MSYLVRRGNFPLGVIKSLCCVIFNLFLAWANILLDTLFAVWQRPKISMNKVYFVLERQRQGVCLTKL
jgi:hypothetical protein